MLDLKLGWYMFLEWIKELKDKYRAKKYKKYLSEDK